MKARALTPKQQWALCCRKARRIVRNHRKKIPKGHEYCYSWIAVGVAVVGATVSAVQAHKQAQAQKAAAAQQAQAVQNNQLPAFKPPPMPSYVPFDFAGTQKGAIEEDRQAYARSDKDFATRHAPTLQAEKIFEDQTLKDQKGDSELMPAIQSALTRAGIQGSLQSFGGNGANLEPGSAGEANVARNLGVGIEQFQDRNRQNRQASLGLAEQIFPRRQFGMNGSDFAMTALQDAVNQNQFNQANYQAQTGVYEKNYDVNAANKNATVQSQNALAQANTEAKAAQSAAIANSISSVAGAYAGARGNMSGGQVGVGQASATREYVPGVGTAYRPNYASAPGSNTWVPVGKYA